MAAEKTKGEDRHAVGRAGPAETPRWITPELIALTIRIWQPFYGKAQLTTADAVQIIVGVGRLVAVLPEG